MLQNGTVLEGRYRLISEGTSQDLGMMYKAHDMQRDRLVTVLVLASRFVSGVAAWDRLAKSQEAVANLAQPGLIPFETVGLIDGQVYVVRRLVAGRTLADLLVQAGRLEIGTAVEIAIRLCEALAPAHRVGLVHGGLSPQSVRVGDGGQVTVTDMGLLPALRPVHTLPGQPWGRYPHLSPEHAAGENVHPPSDVYVIGALLYEMLTGRPPFRAHDRAVLVRQHMRQEPPSLQILVPQVPLPLAQIVHKALAKEPVARYRNAGQLAHILRSQLGPRPASRRAELAAGNQVPPREHLVVPAPPAQPRPVATRPAREIYTVSREADEWEEESAGVDWLMVGLIIAALIAVLGLIPLWRTVRSRYAAPTSVPTPVSYHLPGVDASWSLPCTGPRKSQAQATTELGDFGLVWYNAMAPRLLGVGQARRSRQVQSSPVVWESSLRVLGAS
jgi:serine/threonine protein kinase